MLFTFVFFFSSKQFTFHFHNFNPIFPLFQSLSLQNLKITSFRKQWRLAQNHHPIFVPNAKSFFKMASTFKTFPGGWNVHINNVKTVFLSGDFWGDFPVLRNVFLKRKKNLKLEEVSNCNIPYITKWFSDVTKWQPWHLR